MNDENIDRKLHELMGRCWHDPELQMCHQAPNTGSALCGEKHWYCKKCGNQTSGDPGGNGGSRGRYYSTSISDAMEAVDWARRERGWGFRLATVKHKWSALFSSGVVEGHVICESREKAITLALIEALEAKP